MPHWLVLTLLPVFAVHFVIFFYLLIKSKDAYYAFVSCTFFLLVISYSLRLWDENWLLAGLKGYWIFRMAAWSTAAISIYLTIRRRFSAKKKGR